MNQLWAGVGGLLMLCLVLRVAAWLVTPAIPLLAVLTLVSSLLYFILIGRPNRR
jgi:hypothetical protein